MDDSTMQIVPAELSRELERELAAANAREARLREAATRVSNEWRRVLELALTYRASIYDTTPELRDALSAQGAALAPSGPSSTAATAKEEQR